MSHLLPVCHNNIKIKRMTIRPNYYNNQPHSRQLPCSNACTHQLHRIWSEPSYHPPVTYIASLIPAFKRPLQRASISLQAQPTSILFYPPSLPMFFTFLSNFSAIVSYFFIHLLCQCFLFFLSTFSANVSYFFIHHLCQCILLLFIHLC